MPFIQTVARQPARVGRLREILTQFERCVAVVDRGGDWTAADKDRLAHLRQEVEALSIQVQRDLVLHALQMDRRTNGGQELTREGSEAQHSD